MAVSRLFPHEEIDFGRTNLPMNKLGLLGKYRIFFIKKGLRQLALLLPLRFWIRICVREHTRKCHILITNPSPCSRFKFGSNRYGSMIGDDGDGGDGHLMIWLFHRRQHMFFGMD